MSSEISGSASVYTVNFTDYNSGVSCGLAKIPAADCVTTLCKHSEQLPVACQNFTRLRIRFYASNIFGGGLAAEPIVLGNTFSLQ